MANDHIYADGISAVQLTNGNLRIHLVQQGSEEGQTVPAATLIVPAVRAQAILGALNKSVERIVDEVRKRRDARATEGDAPAEGGEGEDESVTLKYDA